MDSNSDCTIRIQSPIWRGAVHHESSPSNSSTTVESITYMCGCIYVYQLPSSWLIPSQRKCTNLFVHDKSRCADTCDWDNFFAMGSATNSGLDIHIYTSIYVCDKDGLFEMGAATNSGVDIYICTFILINTSITGCLRWNEPRTQKLIYI